MTIRSVTRCIRCICQTCLQPMALYISSIQAIIHTPNIIITIRCFSSVRGQMTYCKKIKNRQMKRTLIYIMAVLLLLPWGCTEIPSEKGFLSPDLYLKGSDTLYLPLGSKGSTDVAWLDGSTQPVEFSIENVRDANGQRSEQFFVSHPYRTWVQPYNNKTDTTLELVNAKLAEIPTTPLFINPVNGMLQYLETTNSLESPGDVFHVDVRAKNTAGEHIYSDYAVLKLSEKSRPFEVYWVTTSILLVNDAGESIFTLYDDITENDLERRQNIIDRNGKEFLEVYKV